MHVHEKGIHLFRMRVNKCLQKKYFSTNVYRMLSKAVPMCSVDTLSGVNVAISNFVHCQYFPLIRI